MKSIPMSDLSYTYAINHSETIPAVLQELRAFTAKRADAGMQISVDQGLFLGMLAGLINAKKIVEIGCFTGYSAISMARNLTSGGKLITLEIDAENAQVATQYFQKAEISDRIELRLGEALSILPQIKLEYGLGSFDMAFIDADKENLIPYYEHCLELIRPSGLIIVDNVLWSGRVLTSEDQTNSTKAIREFNDRLSSDVRVEKVMLHIADGLFLARKK